MTRELLSPFRWAFQSRLEPEHRPIRHFLARGRYRRTNSARRQVMNQRAFATITQVRRHVLKALGAVYIQRLIIQHFAEIGPNAVLIFAFRGVLTGFFGFVRQIHHETSSSAPGQEFGNRPADADRETGSTTQGITYGPQDRRSRQIRYRGLARNCGCAAVMVPSFNVVNILHFLASE